MKLILNLIWVSLPHEIIAWQLVNSTYGSLKASRISGIVPFNENRENILGNSILAAPPTRRLWPKVKFSRWRFYLPDILVIRECLCFLNPQNLRPRNQRLFVCPYLWLLHGIIGQPDSFSWTHNSTETDKTGREGLGQQRWGVGRHT